MSGKPAVAAPVQSASLTLRLILEARTIMASPGFDSLRVAVGKCEHAEVRAAGRRIVYQPDFPDNRCGMTLSGEAGFLLGPRAFASREELYRTVLQELYRLRNGGSGAAVDARRARRRTLEARAFSDRAYDLGRRLALL
jgi:hypothetical protein